MMRREEKRYEHMKKKALEPQERYCTLQKKKVCILVEYQDYKSSHYKGDQGTIYCENIVECYHNRIPCRYSGISPSYPDPLIPVEMAARMFPEEGGSDGEEKKCGNGVM